MKDKPEAAAQKKAGKRAGDGDVEFLLRAGGIALDSGQAAKDEQGDGLHLNLVMPGD